MRCKNERHVFINGRFLSRPLTGVERVATEILRELAQMIKAHPDLKLHLSVIVPNMGAEQLSLAQSICDDLGFALINSQTKGYLWEQLELPLCTIGAPLLSFCNLGPVFKRKQLVVIHDAQIYTQPASYTRLFRAAYKILLPVLARFSKHVVTVSKNTKHELEGLGVLPKGKAHVIYNAADHVLRIKPSVEIPAKPPYFMVFGSQAAHKNVATIISAMADYTEGDVPLVIAGGSNARIFQSSAAQETAGIKRLGRLSDEALVTLYKNATALVFPSLTEGFGIPPLEAMQLGCPVIASTGGAIPEACGDAALYVSPKDVDGWAEALRNLAASSDLQNELRAKGFEHAANFSWERAAGLYLDLIVDLVSDGARKRLQTGGQGAADGTGEETQKSVSI